MMPTARLTPEKEAEPATLPFTNAVEDARPPVKVLLDAESPAWDGIAVTPGRRLRLLDRASPDDPVGNARNSALASNQPYREGNGRAAENIRERHIPESVVVQTPGLGSALLAVIQMPFPADKVPVSPVTVIPTLWPGNAHGGRHERRKEKRRSKSRSHCDDGCFHGASPLGRFYQCSGRSSAILDHESSGRRTSSPKSVGF